MKSVVEQTTKELREVQRPFWFSDFLGKSSSDDDSNDNSAQDYIVKFCSPIMENFFRGCDIRLKWGETIPPVCSKVGYQCKIDMRVTVLRKSSVDLSVVEYAKAVKVKSLYIKILTR